MNRAAFFASVRAKPFGGSLSQAQVEGMDAILSAASAYGVKDVRHLAYALATAYHETARTMQPIKEYGGTAYFTRMYDVKGERPELARKMGNTVPGDGPRYCGRGYVQLTWRVNYERAGKEIGADLVASPDLAMTPENAARIMFAGMEEGWFTGKKLADYFSASKDDPVQARRIINGTDKASTIAGYHASFLAALNAAGWDGVADHPRETTPVAPYEPAPVQDNDTAPAVSFWAAVFSAISALFKGAAK
jgi:putative chitinase